MSKPELGIKRVCAGCSARFYDLNKNPIVCPTCATVFVVPEPPPPQRPRRVVPTSISVVAPAPVAAEEPVDTADDDAVPLLEEADEDDTTGAEVDGVEAEDDEEDRV